MYSGIYFILKLNKKVYILCYNIKYTDIIWGAIMVYGYILFIFR